MLHKNLRLRFFSLLSTLCLLGACATSPVDTGKKPGPSAEPVALQSPQEPAQSRIYTLTREGQNYIYPQAMPQSERLPAERDAQGQIYLASAYHLPDADPYRGEGLTALSLLSAQGEPLWTQGYRLNVNFVPSSMLVTNDAVYLTGFGSKSGFQVADQLVLMKLSLEGKALWTRTVPDPDLATRPLLPHLYPRKGGKFALSAGANLYLFTSTGAVEKALGMPGTVTGFYATEQGLYVLDQNVHLTYLDAQGQWQWTRSYPLPNLKKTVRAGGLASVDGQKLLLAMGTEGFDFVLLQVDSAGEVIQGQHLTLNTRSASGGLYKRYVPLSYTDVQDLQAQGNGFWLQGIANSGALGDNIQTRPALKLDAQGQVLETGPQFFPQNLVAGQTLAYTRFGSVDAEQSFEFAPTESSARGCFPERHPIEYNSESFSLSAQMASNPPPQELNVGTLAELEPEEVSVTLESQTKSCH